MKSMQLFLFVMFVNVVELLVFSCPEIKDPEISLFCAFLRDDVSGPEKTKTKTLHDT